MKFYGILQLTICIFIPIYEIKDRNGMGLTEAQHIKKRWKEYTEVYKKDLNDHDNLGNHDS